MRYNPSAAINISKNIPSGIDGNQVTKRTHNVEGEILAQFQPTKTNGKVIQKFPFKKVIEKIKPIH